MDDLALLRLQIEWGADEALDAEPLDRLRPAAAIVAERPRPTVVAPAAAPSRPQGMPVERALAAAGQAGSLDALRAAIAGFDGCALRDTASNLVFAEGDPATGLLIVGDPPGSEEDRSGRPFANDLLDRMLASVGLDRSRAVLAPLIPWRPPGGRVPNAGEVAVCLPFLQRLIALVAPERMLLFSAQAARALLPPAPNRRRPVVGWTDCPVPGLARPVATLALPALDAVQKMPQSRRDAWAGLRMLRRALDADS